MADADNKYENGKIYELVYKDKRYIGSTTRTLQQRYSIHIADYKRGHLCTSRLLFELSDANGDTVLVNLIEEYPCNNRTELEAREGYHIERFRVSSGCVNKVTPGRSVVEQHRIYHEANKPKIAEYKAEYYQANKDTILEQRKVYRDAADKNAVSDYQKRYRDSFPMIDCPCTGRYKQCRQSAHFKTKLHIAYVNRLKE